MPRMSCKRRSRKAALDKARAAKWAKKNASVDSDLAQNICKKASHKTSLEKAKEAELLRNNTYIDVDDLDFKVSGKKGYLLVTIDDSKHLKVEFENTIHVEVVFKLLKKDSDFGDVSDSCRTQNNEYVSKEMAEKILALLGKGDDLVLTDVINDGTDSDGAPETEESVYLMSAGPEAKEQTLVDGNQEILLPYDYDLKFESIDLNDTRNPETPGGESTGAKLHDYQEPATCIETTRTKRNITQKVLDEGWAYHCRRCGLGFPSYSSCKQHRIQDHGETQPYQCNVCDKSFSSAYLRDTHRKNAHDLVKEWICKLCRMNFYSLRSLIEHKRSTHMNKEKEYKCTFCDKTFQMVTHYERHKKLAKHGIYCEICKQTFQTTGLLNQHLYDEHLEDRDEEGNLLLKRCLHCILLFSTDTALEKHKLIHDVNNRKWICDHCQRRFSSYSGLQKHINEYHIRCDRNNQCPICGKVFSLRKWQRHKTKCEKKKSYVCKICQKAFIERKYLLKHMRSHTKEKPFQCAVCAKGFTQNYNLTTHMRTHTKEKPFSCSFCDMKFGHKCSLQGHVERKHPGQSLQQRMEHVGNGDTCNTESERDYVLMDATLMPNPILPSPFYT